MAYYVHNLSPFLFEITDNWGIRWYGLAYFLGFLIATYYLRSYQKRGVCHLTYELQSTLMLLIIFGVVGGGRLGYCFFYDWDYFKNNPLIFFNFFNGGMSSHGGFLGVTFVLYYFAKSKKTSLLSLSDITITLVPPGLFLGRVANFINGELWGKPSNIPWAVIFPNSHKTSAIAEIIPRHPSQLYQAFTEGLLLWLFTQWRFKKFTVLKKIPSGHISGEFLILYALFRIFCEQFREPDAALIIGLSRGSFFSFFLLFFGFLLILVSNYLHKKKRV